MLIFFFFFNDTATTEIYTLSLHDALPILVGRLISAGVADHFGLAANFYFFSFLNLAGALLVYFTIRTTMPIFPAGGAASKPLAIWSQHLHNPPLLASFGIGFCILFAFIGTFTYINFVLVREPLVLSRMALGL